VTTPNAPWGEQQAQVDWLESRYDDMYESESDAYDEPDANDDGSDEYDDDGPTVFETDEDPF
jgi:hypothetical protein